MDPTKGADLEARLAELDRRLADAHDGYAFYGPCTLKSAQERGQFWERLNRDSSPDDSPKQTRSP